MAVRYEGKSCDSRENVVKCVILQGRWKGVWYVVEPPAPLKKVNMIFSCFFGKCRKYSPTAGSYVNIVIPPTNL